MEKTAVAVIGAGGIGRMHIDTILRSPACMLAGIAEPAAAGEELAERHGVPWCGDAEALLDAVKPDAAIIATPNATHRAMALACIARGIPAIVEKPIASTLEDAAAIVEASERAGVPILVGHHRRHNPIIRRAHGLIAEGLLGRLTSASVLYAFYKPPEYFDLAWRREPGGGPVLINLIHEIDLIRHLCGEVATVLAVTSNATRAFEVEDTAAVLLRLTNGALVTVNLCDTAAAPWSWDLAVRESPNYPAQPRPVQTHFICGAEGSLALPTLEHWSYKDTRSWFLPITRDEVGFEPGDPYIDQLHHFCRVSRREEAPLISAADGTRTLRATLAVHKAAQTGQTVVLD